MAHPALLTFKRQYLRNTSEPFIILLKLPVYLEDSNLSKRGIGRR